MKFLYAGIIALGSLFSAVALADQDMMNTQPKAPTSSRKRKAREWFARTKMAAPTRK